MKRIYAAIDLKSFFASVECVERGLDPLSTNLVVADSSRSEKTICLALTPPLKNYGLGGRPRLFQVIQKSEEIRRLTGKPLEYITAVPRMSLYIKYSADIYEVYLKYFSPDDIHVYSIDEVFIDLTTYLALYQIDARSLCQKVVKDILKKTGITATVGIGTNLFLCKVAMDIVAKKMPPDEFGVRIAELDEISFRRELWNHKPLTDFWRIGPGISNRLEKNFMYTLGDVARRSLTEEGVKRLYKIFGIDAEILIDHAWGYEPCTMKHIKSYKSEAKSIGSGQVLHQPYDFEMARLIVKEMTENLVLDLQSKGYVSASFSLMVGYEIIKENGEKFLPKAAAGSFSTGEPTCVLSKITERMMDLYDYIVNPCLYIRRVNLSANNVMLQKSVQPELFEMEKSDKDETDVQKAVLQIQKKFGKNAMIKAHSLEEFGTTIERNKQIGGHKA
ncbi:MAG: DNA methylase [Spirochaetaceae bacterium]|nr:DNA methylase [Spirochaetaceae bacterium]